MLRMVAGIDSAVVFVIWSAKINIKILLVHLVEILVMDIVYLVPLDTIAVHVIPPGAVEQLNMQ